MVPRRRTGNYGKHLVQLLRGRDTCRGPAGAARQVQRRRPHGEHTLHHKHGNVQGLGTGSIAQVMLRLPFGQLLPRTQPQRLHSRNRQRIHRFRLHPRRSGQQRRTARRPAHHLHHDNGNVAVQAAARTVEGQHTVARRGGYGERTEDAVPRRREILAPLPYRLYPLRRLQL